MQTLERCVLLMALSITAVGHAKEARPLSPCETDQWQQGWRFSGHASADRVTAVSRAPRQRFEIRMDRDRTSGDVQHSIRFLPPSTDVLACEAQQAHMAMVLDGVDERRETQQGTCGERSMRYVAEPDVSARIAALRAADEVLFSYRETRVDAAGAVTDLGGYDIRLPGFRVAHAFRVADSLLGQMRAGRDEGRCAPVER